MTPNQVDVDRAACHCDGPALVAYEEADWKPGNPTGVYCDRCGYTFGYYGGYEP